VQRRGGGLWLCLIRPLLTEMAQSSPTKPGGQMQRK
jgi:hypothetical protein